MSLEDRLSALQPHPNLLQLIKRMRKEQGLREQILRGDVVFILESLNIELPQSELDILLEVCHPKIANLNVFINALARKLAND